MAETLDLDNRRHRTGQGSAKQVLRISPACMNASMSVA
ncbi:hypothetical protein EMIT0111MI5_30322 [Burkholderia sp. IT-111MI5]